MTKRTTTLLCVLAALLSAWSLIAADPFALVGDSLESLPEPIQMVVCVVMMPFMLLHGYSFMIGTGIFALLAARACRQRLPKTHTSGPLLFPMVSIAWLALQATPFFRVPAGSSIRPMGWAAFTMMSAFLLMLCSLGTSIASLRKQKNKTGSVLAIILSLTIVVVPGFALHAVAQIKGFSLSP